MTPSLPWLESLHQSRSGSLADDGRITLIWRPTSFLDARFASRLNPTSSQRATAAWGCAVDAGIGAMYHSNVFASQPDEEGEGWNDDALKELAMVSGIDEPLLPAFNACVESGKYLPWAANSNVTFQNKAIPGTPSAFLNGTEIPSDALKDSGSLQTYLLSYT